MTVAYIGLGSNLDQPESHIEKAVDELARLPACEQFIAVSPLYRSRPMGPQDQPDFINAVACLETGYAASDLLADMQRIEQKHGRKRDGVRWGPRPLDLDLLLFGHDEIAKPYLTVPHSGLAERSFVLYPLADIAPPELWIPGHGRLDSLLANVDGADVEKIGVINGGRDD